MKHPALKLPDVFFMVCLGIILIDFNLAAHC